MKRIAFLSLLMVPAVAGAQQSDQIHTAPYTGGQSAAVDQGVAAYEQRPVLSQQGGPGCPSDFHTACASTGGWFGDVGFYILRPQWSGGNPAFGTTTTTAINGDVATTAAQSDFDHDYNFAPLVQIGYAGRNGLGVRGRWWTLRSTESVTGDATVDADFALPSLLGTTAFADFGADIEAAEGGFRNRLDLDVIDLESIWETRVGRSSLLFSGGVRYAHIGQTYDADVLGFDELGDLEADETLRSKNTFNGAGPTASLQAYRMIGQTNLSVYGLSRGSLLFGESRQRASSSMLIDPVDDITVSNSASLTYESVRPIMELEVGTNWTRNMGAFDLFAESGLVGMVWFDAGNAANTDTLLGGSANANQDLGLLGLRFSSGVRF